MPVAQFGRPPPVQAQAVPSANDDAEASPELWARIQPASPSAAKSDRVCVAIEWPKERRLAGAGAPNLVVWVRKEVRDARVWCVVWATEGCDVRFNRRAAPIEQLALNQLERCDRQANVRPPAQAAPAPNRASRFRNTSSHPACPRRPRCESTRTRPST